MNRRYATRATLSPFRSKDRDTFGLPTWAKLFGPVGRYAAVPLTRPTSATFTVSELALSLSYVPASTAHAPRSFGSAGGSGLAPAFVSASRTSLRPSAVANKAASSASWFTLPVPRTSCSTATSPRFAADTAAASTSFAPALSSRLTTSTFPLPRKPPSALLSGVWYQMPSRALTSAP